MKDKINFLQLARYSGRNEKGFRKLFSKGIDLYWFNYILIEQHIKQKAIAFDPSYINKAGKHTQGVGYYWSGVAGAKKWGLELGGLAVLDLDRHTAFHLKAMQTLDMKKDETPCAYYARRILDYKDSLHQLSNYIVVDAFFSNYSFIKPMKDHGFDVISRLRSNADLKYLYQATTQKKSRGRPKQYDGKVCFNKLSDTHATLVSEQDKERIYHLQAYSVPLKRNINLVIVYRLTKAQTWQHYLYFSTDLQQGWQAVLQLYQTRFQIEFLYRDAKQHTGLNDCEARCKNKIDLHWNLSLTAINLAKVVHWLPIKDSSLNVAVPFSMSDIKTSYNNELVLDRFIRLFGINRKLPINCRKFAQFLNFGRKVA